MDNNELTEYDEPAAVPNALPEEIPTEVKRVVQQQFSMMMGMTGTQEPSVAKKINEQHIDKMLDNDKLAMEHEARDREQSRLFEDKERIRKFWLTIIIAFISLFVFGFVVVLFKDNKDILIPVLTLLFGSGLGFGGGYGIGKSKKGD